MNAISRPDLTGPNYAHNHHRVERQAEIEDAISAWTKERTVEDVEKVMMDAGVPVGRVNSVKEIMEIEHLKARGAVEDVWVGGEGAAWNVKMPRVFPKIEGWESDTRWAGPDLGEHTKEVLVEELGMDEEEYTKLKLDGIIGWIYSTAGRSFDSLTPSNHSQFLSFLDTFTPLNTTRHKPLIPLAPKLKPSKVF